MKLGVTFECNTLVGRLFTIEQMLDEMGFDAVFIGTGAGYPAMLGIPGDSLNGVLSANELLTRCNLMRARDFPTFDTPLPPGRHVAVVGAGNTAMDAMRVCLRLGAEQVSLRLPAQQDRVSGARRGSASRRTGRRRSSTGSPNPVEILDDGAGGVRGMRCVRMELGEPDDVGPPAAGAGRRAASTRSRPISSCSRSARTRIRSWARRRRSRLNTRGYIETDDDLATSIAGVFAGGDIVTGAATVIEAMGAGRKAARSMKAYLGIRDVGRAVSPARRDGAGTLFGIDARERNFVRVRA